MAEIDVPRAPALVTIAGVELAQAGTWRLSTGETTITREDLAAAIGAADCPAVRNPILKLGHIDARFDGEPAVGWISGMRLTDDGNTVTGDYRGVPAWLGDILPSAYPDRSIEATRNFRCQIGHTHQMVITAVALLGVAAPGIGTLASLQDVAALYDVAASESAGGEPVTYTMQGGPMPPPTPELAAGVSSEDVRRRYYEHAGYTRWICEIQLDPLQLIVMDDSTGGYYRVPVTTSGDEVSFGEAVAVAVEYVDKSSKMAAAVFASRAESVPEDLRAASVSDKPWSDFSEADYTIEQWRKACLIGPSEASESKSDYKLPVREPSGTLNRNACHAAASRIGQVSGVSDDDKKAAAKKLVSLYKNQLDEDPPESLTKLAGMDAAAPTPPEPPAQGEPATQTPVTNPVSGPTKQEDTDMQFSDEQAAKLRAALGLPEGSDLDPAQLLDGVEKLAASESSPGKTPKNTPGTITVDRQVWDDQQKRIAKLENIAAAQQRNERERMVDDAIRAGKFAPSRRDHWLRVAEADPKGTAELLAGLTPGVVPVEDNGLPGSESFDLDTEFAGLFPPEK
ncbi:hypothetical protein AB0K40_17790 [Nonomuraea bangladeshensis]|uniref:Uncharacterized protein n=1 Tax=Nonomuraea bangladeshensis TaxID=404385 RepID=A0ABV3H4J1_9ACTN